MPSTGPPRRTIYRTRRRRAPVAGLLAVLAAVAAALSYELPASSSPSSAESAPIEVPRSERLRPADHGADPEVANLDSDLRAALRRAAADAAREGLDLVVTSGWRSPEHQLRLLQDAVAKYGSEQEAARWVATPESSAHVSGDAVDVGPSDAAAWLSARSAEYGLCRIYDNEPWHFELRPEAVGSGCPRTYPDPTHDPRMQQ